MPSTDFLMDVEAELRRRQAQTEVIILPKAIEPRRHRAHKARLRTALRRDLHDMAWFFDRAWAPVRRAM